MSTEKKAPENFVAYDEAAGVAIITLASGLVIDGTKVMALSMREPDVNDQLVAEAMKGSDGLKEVQTFANLCDVTADDIRRLKMRDYRRVQAAYTGFAD